jgi:tripartite-type tricarboxylate transporter receptor subunit TctC
MKIPRRQFLELAAVVVALPAVSRIARAQGYPSRPITMIVPFPPGGGTDVVGRLLAERMRVSLGQPVIIENVGGANGSIGVGRAARAASDGYTFALGAWSTFVANGAIYTPTYDLLMDFEPVSLVASQPYLIVARKTMAAGDLKGLIAWLKENQDRASAGTQGVGGSSHIGGAFFQSATGTRFQFVPYRGGAPAIQDLVAGQIDLMVAALGDCLEQVRAGNIRAYAVTAAGRLAATPDVPTVDEAGLPGFYFSNWFAFWAPARSPKSNIAKLNAAIVEALSDSRVRARLADLGQEIFPREQQTPEALAAFHKAEIEKWWPIIKAAGIKAQ